MCGRIHDCLQNNHVCTRVWAIFPRIANPIRGKRPNFRVGQRDYLRMAWKFILTMEIEKLYMQMED